MLGLRRALMIWLTSGICAHRGVRVVFLDLDHTDRLHFLCDAFTAHIAQIQSQVSHTDRTIAVWSRSQELVVKLNFTHALVPYFNQVDGLNILSGNRHPPLHYRVERRLLGTISERFGLVTERLHFKK